MTHQKTPVRWINNNNNDNNNNNTKEASQKPKINLAERNEAINQNKNVKNIKRITVPDYAVTCRGVLGVRCRLQSSRRSLWPEAEPSGNPSARAQTEFKPGVESWWGSRVVGERSGAPAERRRRGREFPTVTRIRTFVWVDYSKARLSARPAPLVRVGIPIKFGLTRSGLL